ncbi:YhzD family protein [Melghirimyces profundicolus]|nr:YhzD family protein [Melghirimyces profundicolus]
MTVFDQEGNKLVDEALEAKSDSEAKEKGQAILREKEYSHLPYRIVHRSGRLVEFLSHKAKKAKAEA